MNKALQYLGLARKSGSIELGEENAKALIKAGKARLVLLAADASEGVTKRVNGYVYGFRARVLRLPFDASELGGALGRAKCSAAAISDLGLAAALTAALAEEPDSGDKGYAEAARELAEKQARIAARKTAKPGKRRKSE